ncbi:sensor histidine kinase [Glutamicibacter protophormiae]|uniref:sensor histidine kinase n=1 Tax=Glutamicibacter protophormiae TaxID=37930 RepID=UPI001956A97C|nr:PAS domain-containing sensor histidine kinase [Glutamicibacter protophormiae]QRQ77449.1 histidine kinase N-terminal domain-containing protein [Glutamicibacter protophormiae]
MALITEDLRHKADLGPGDEDWLHLLVGDWQLVSDLAFADLVLWFPTGDGSYVALAHVRPSTSHTTFHTDFVGERIRKDLRLMVDRAWDSRTIQRSAEHPGADLIPGLTTVQAVPLVRQHRTVAVLTSHFDRSQSRTPSNLELVYRQSADDLLAMGTKGLWPDFASPTGSRRGAPRVGDGFIRLSVEGTVEFASPNAVSAFRRLGAADVLQGQPLADLTMALVRDRRVVDETLPLVLQGKMPWRTEVEYRGVTLSLRAIPLRDESKRWGALVLCRDVSELRRREKELVTKDATIREIHHRVKNNLQTVAALLRMQSRRMSSDEGKQGLEQAMRRVSTIASVHEFLSKGLNETVKFDDLMDRQFRLIVEIASPGQKVSTRREGEFGMLDADLATPLSLVINELVTNAVEHGLANRDGQVALIAERYLGADTKDWLRVIIEDDGHGLPEGERREGLGLQIVRTLVNSELSGEIHWLPGHEGGTRVVIEMPLTLDRRAQA